MGDYKQEDCIMTEIKTSKDTMKLTKNSIYFSHTNSSHIKITSYTLIKTLWANHLGDDPVIKAWD